jgi:hypothetical protein
MEGDGGDTVKETVKGVWEKGLECGRDDWETMIR